MILQLLNFKWRLHPRGSHPLLAPFQNFLGSLPQEIYRDSSALLQTYQLRTQETGLKNLFRKRGFSTAQSAGQSSLGAATGRCSGRFAAFSPRSTTTDGIVNGDLIEAETTVHSQEVIINKPLESFSVHRFSSCLLSNATDSGIVAFFRKKLS